VPIVCLSKKFGRYCVPVFVNKRRSNLSDAPCCISGRTCE